MILLLAARTKLGPDEALRSGTARARLFDYFAGEVLAGMSAADAAALMRIAFLPSASAAMAVAISGNAQAGELLAGLARPQFSGHSDPLKPLRGQGDCRI